MITRLALVAFALTAVAGCDEGIKRTESNDIFLSPAAITFPRISPPRTDVKNVDIRHGGVTELRIDRIYLEDFPECDRVDLGYAEADRLPDDVKAMCPLMIDSRGERELPTRLSDSGFFTVNIRFQPSDASVPPPTRLVVESNALGKEIQYVEIGFQAAVPEIAGEAVVSFPGGTPGTEFLLIRNIGTGPLTVSQRTLSLVSEPAIDPQTQEPVEEFVVTEDTALPWLIPENGAETVTIEYRPFDGNRDTAELVFLSNDPVRPEFRVTLTSAPVFGVLTVEPNPLVFGNPAAGNAVEKSISFTNSGVRFIDVQNIELVQDGEDYRLSGDDPTSFRLAGGATRSTTVQYQPLTAEGSDAVLRITYDDGDDRTPPSTEIPLVRSGDSLPAILSISPAAVELNDVAFGETRAVEIELTNTGGQPLEIGRIALTAEDEVPGVPASDPEFSVTEGGAPVTLSPQQTHTVTVEFTRGAEDRVVHLAALLVESNAGSSPDVIFFSSNPPQD